MIYEYIITAFKVIVGMVTNNAASALAIVAIKNASTPAQKLEPLILPIARSAMPPISGTTPVKTIPISTL